LNIIIEPKM